MIGLNAGVLALSTLHGASSSSKIRLSSISNRISLTQVAAVGTATRSFSGMAAGAADGYTEPIDPNGTTWERHADA